MSGWLMTALSWPKCKHCRNQSWLLYHTATPHLESSQMQPAERCVPFDQVEAAALLQQLLPVKERVAAADAALLRVDPARSVTKAFRVRTGAFKGASIFMTSSCLEDQASNEVSEVSCWSLSVAGLHFQVVILRCAFRYCSSVLQAHRQRRAGPLQS